MRPTKNYLTKKKMKSLNQYISQVKDLHSLNEYISEQLSDVKTSWHPKKGLFAGDNPKEIVDYLMKNSKDQVQAMQRLCFYMNRGGDNLPNKTVLNKAKQLLKKEKVDEKLIVNKNYKSIGDNKCLLIEILIFGKDDNDLIFLQVHDNCKVEDDKITLYPLYSSSKDAKLTILKKIDNYYFWKSESSSLKVYVVGLDYDESMEFLSQISNNIPKKININDYYSESPDRECEFKFYDSGTQTYKHYEKKDIDKLIDDLNK